MSGVILLYDEVLSPLWSEKKKCLADYIDCSFLYFGLGRRGEHSVRPPPPLALTENNLQLSS